MSEVENWERKVKGLQANIDALNNKKEFYERELRYQQQQLDEAEMMLNEARYLEDLKIQKGEAEIKEIMIRRALD